MYAQTLRQFSYIVYCFKLSSKTQKKFITGITVKQTKQLVSHKRQVSNHIYLIMANFQEKTRERIFVKHDCGIGGTFHASKTCYLLKVRLCGT